MKKVLLIGLLVFVLLLGGGVFAGYRVADSRFGLSESPVVGYEEIVAPDVRGVILLQPEKGLTFVNGLLPAETNLPAWIPWNVQEVLAKALVREAAILIGPDTANHKIGVTVFANEKLGGPFIVEQSATQSFFTEPGLLAWNDPPFELPSRGTLKGQAFLPVSPEVIATAQQFSQPLQGAAAIQISREHLAEAYLDNTDGTLLLLAGAIAESNGSTLTALLDIPQAKALGTILKQTQSLKLAANVTGPDTITLQIAIAPRAAATEDDKKMFPSALTFFMLLAPPEIKKRSGLELAWVEGKKPLLADGIVTAELTISGFRERLQQAINQGLAKK